MNWRERAASTLFWASIGFNGVAAVVRRGAETVRTRGFFDSGQTFVTTRGSTFRAVESRTLVVERSALGAFYPPRPRDVFEIEEAAGVRRYEVFANDTTPPFYAWQKDARFVAINLTENASSDFP